MLVSSFKIEKTHPSLAGHFPDYPIAPGVVTLDYIVSALIKQLPGAKLCEIMNVKFLRPLCPDEKVTVKYTVKQGAHYQFQCEHDGVVIIVGKLKLIFEGG